MNPLPKLLIKEINKLSDDELHALNHYIGDRLTALRQAHDFVALKKFALLDYVSFLYNGELKKGTIIRLNQRSATVLSDNDAGRWNVSPHLLTKIVGVRSPMAILAGKRK